MYKNSIFTVALFTLLAITSSCNEANKASLPEPELRDLTVNEVEIVGAANNFTFDLMTEIEKAAPNENYFISSFSVNTALSMLLNGASDASQEGFIETLGLSGLSADQINASYKSLNEYIYGLDPSVTLNIANSNWYSDQYTINNDFANTLTEYYTAEIFKRDFASAATLNDLNAWVEAETNGKIKNVLESISPDEVMFLINAIYFKASWTTKFDTNLTQELPFTLANGQEVDVPTMRNEVKHWLAYDQSLQAQIIEIPYGNENYAFTIIMPDDASAVHELVAKMDVNRLNTVLADSTTRNRDLYLPKFQLKFKKDLKNPLVNMGMPLGGLENLFDENLPLAISKVIHQSFLEVNEEGSEAAAVTVIGIELTSAPAVTRVDKPFVFLIRERNTGTILFSGMLLDPR